MLRLPEVIAWHLAITLAKNQKYKGIFLAKKYLEDDCGIAFPKGGHPWQQMQHYNRIRNAIVHRRSCISGWKDEEAVRSYTKVNNAVSIDNFDRLRLSKEFCLQVLDNVEALLEDLFKLAQERVSDLHSEVGGVSERVWSSVVSCR